MIKPLEAILFATDLTPDCQQAYDYAVSLSMRFKATVYILYIIETMPDNVEGQLKGLLGRHRWESILETKKAGVRKSLTGKMTSAKLLHDIKEFCQNVGMREEECDFQSREVIISAGDLSETILKTARENECDLIVMASREGALSRNSVGDTIKTVLKQAPVPVTVVPFNVES